MIEFYHRPRTRAVRLVWAAEELGIPYEIKPADFRAPSPEFLAVSPVGTLPGMKDGDLVLTESVAITQYLADTYAGGKLTVKPGQKNYPIYLQYLIFGEASLAAYLTPVIGTMFFAPADQKESWTLDRCKASFAGRLKQVELQLEKTAYIAGDDFTLADISVGYALYLAPLVGLADARGPRTKAYWDKISARPAAAIALAA
jgi:glutathione S-transferase